MHAEECMRGDSDRVPAARKAANSGTNSRATKTDQSCRQPTPPTDSAQLLSYMTSAGTACATTRHGRVEGMTQNCDASLRACKCVLCVLVGAVQRRRCAPNGGGCRNVHESAPEGCAQVNAWSRCCSLWCSMRMAAADAVRPAMCAPETRVSFAGAM